MTFKKLSCVLLLFLGIHLVSRAQSAYPGIAEIDKQELKRDLFTLASDDMRGRRAGTLDELRAAVWMAQRAREVGLEPAGEDGTFFQFFDLYRKQVSELSSFKLNDQNLKLWKDVWETSPVDTQFKGTVTWLKSIEDTTNIQKSAILATDLKAPSKLPAEGMSLWVYRYALSAIREQSDLLKKQQPQAIILVADSTASSKISFFGHSMEEGKYQIDPYEDLKGNDTIPVFLVSQKYRDMLMNSSATISAKVKVNSYTYPSANVVAKAPGRDPELKEEFVLFSGHHDHDGVGEPIEGDSIWNGADDNASVSVAILAAGKAWVKHPGKRSALIVWHGAEERGLWGSRYFSKHPTVAKEKIVAVLNGDMIGRNEKGKAALLGSIPPHKNSTELVDMAMKANDELTKFEVDTSWDAEDHPEFWYFRSDHLPYAQTDIPSIFFTTLLHPDYHTPKDEADRIDLDKLTEMTKWMYATGWKVSETNKRPALDKTE